MARASPMARWTRGALKTPTGATGMMPRSTLVRLGLVEGPRTAGDGVDAMEVMLQRLAGLDGPKATVVACVRLVVGRKGTRDCRTFATPTASRRALLAWLAACRGTHVAMAATGVPELPVWKLLGAGGFELMVANAAPLKRAIGTPGSGGAGPRAGCHVDRRFARAWLDQGKFRARRRLPGTALAAAHPANSWAASRPGLSSTCRSRWKRPTSSSTR
jgi:hypothetical protein